MNQAVVGRGSVVAAGTVILEKAVLPPYSLVTGSPGKIKKNYKNREKRDKLIKAMSESYMESAGSFGSNEIFYPIKS